MFAQNLLAGISSFARKFLATVSKKVKRLLSTSVPCYSSMLSDFNECRHWLQKRVEH